MSPREIAACAYQSWRNNSDRSLSRLMELCGLYGKSSRASFTDQDQGIVYSHAKSLIRSWEIHG